MQLENNIPHPHYKRVVIAISIVAAVIILGILIYQLVLVKKTAKTTADLKRQEFETAQLEASRVEAEAFYKEFPPKEMTAEDKKEINAFF